MAFAMLTRYAGASIDQFDDAMAACNLDADPPIGQILHAVVQTPEGIETWDVWQTEETADAFVEQRLAPALRDAGIAEDPEIRVYALHNLFAPDMDTLGRIGAFSLRRAARARRSTRRGRIAAAPVSGDPQVSPGRLCSRPPSRGWSASL